MLLQALLSIAFITLLAGALLTSALVNVKVASHEATARVTTAALARGTDEFVNWAQRYVSKYGASAAWPTSKITDEPTPACLATGTTSSTCSSFVTITYAVIGSSVSSNSGPDLAQNLQETLNENRISGTITATVTAKNGDVESAHTRLVTLRIFNASPFAIVSGVRDGAVIANNFAAAEGDTGGYRDPDFYNTQSVPNPAFPSFVRDTSIGVTMSCSNSPGNVNESNPQSDNHAPGNDFKPWGTSGGTAFETPCSPSYAISKIPTIPADALLPSGNVYDVSSYGGHSWKSSVSSNITWPR